MFNFPPPKAPSTLQVGDRISFTVQELEEQVAGRSHEW